MTTVTMPQILTHSRLSCFRACPRRHYIRYELGVRPEIDGFALRVGSGFHAALEAADKGQDVGATLEAAIADPYDLALVAAMVNGHRTRWAGASLEPVAAEMPFEMPLVNPTTGAPTPLFRLAGVIDRIVRLPDGRLALMEYKTTSRDFSPGAEYWVALHLDQQLSIYVVAARALGYDVQTVLYDVTRRPGQRPSQVPIRDEDGLKIVCGADGSRVRTKDGKKWRETGDAEMGYVVQTRPETPEEYAERVGEAIAASPETHFARIEIARLDQDLAECQQEVWSQQQAIRAAQRGEGWYRNPGACFAPVACDYLSVCANRDIETHTPQGFWRTDDVHPELRGASTAGG